MRVLDALRMAHAYDKQEITMGYHMTMLVIVLLLVVCVIKTGIHSPYYKFVWVCLEIAALSWVLVSVGEVFVR